MTGMLYNLPKGTRFTIQNGTCTGILLGTDGMYSKIHWDGEVYDERRPWDFYMAGVTVDVLGNTGEHNE